LEIELRKKGLLTLIIIFLIFLVIYLIFSDRWLENEMEKVGSTINGALVEFEGVDFSFTQLRLRWDRLQVTNRKNTWRNLFETGKAEFDLALQPLLSKKAIIENFHLEGFKLNTKRETDGKLPEKSAKKSEFIQQIGRKLEREKEFMPVFNLEQYTRKVNVDSLWNLIDLKSPGKIDSLKTAFSDKYEVWQNKIENLPTEEDFQRIVDQIQAIQVEKIKSVEQLQSTLQTLDRTYTRIDSLKKQVSSLKKDFQSDIRNLSTVKSQVQDWITRDYRRVLNLAQLPDISVKNVARLLFGDRILNQIQNVVDYIATARYYANKVKSSTPVKEKQPRLQGQNIYFAPKKGVPKFWIKNISLSGETENQLKLSGNVQDIVSRQKIIGEPTTINLKGVRKDQAGLIISAIFDYREDVPRENLTINLSQMPLSNVKLTDFPLLPYKIKQGKGQIDANLKMHGDNFTADIQFSSSNIQFDFSDKPNDLDQRLLNLSHSIVQSLDNINFKATVKQQQGDLIFRIQSNIDNLIAEKAKQIISDEIENARNEIESRVRQQVDEKRKEIENFIDTRQQDLQKRIQFAEEQIKLQQELLNKKKKEIEDRIESEKNKLKEEIKDKTKDLIKDLFKKP
jgi:uncharacterized protein (TIGR03545 family)